MNTSIYIKDHKVFPGQIWKLSSQEEKDIARIFIIQEVVSENEIYFYGMAHPFNVSEFLWLVPVENIGEESYTVRQKIKEEIIKWNVDPQLYWRPSHAVFVAVIITVLFLMWLLL